MSRYRTTAERKNKEGIPLIKGPNGRNLCRFCQTEVTPPRRTFCSDECVHEWNIRADSRYARRCVYKRDKGICQMCGLNCSRLKKELLALPHEERLKKAAELGIPRHRLNGSLWDVDHIQAVALNGGEANLDGLQSLCLPCHKKKTKQDMIEIRKKSSENS